MKINTLKENDRVEAIFLLGNVNKGKTSNGADYLSLLLQDSSGEIDAKLWQVTPEQLQAVKNGAFALINGNVISYRNKLQLKVEKLELVDQTKVNMDDFVKKAPVEIKDLRNELQQYIYKIDNGIINKVVSLLIKKYEQDLLVYPAAARIHHAYQGGLLHHVVSMLKVADALINLYPELDKNYLYAGIILHDLGKIEELNGVVATEYTLKGKLIGHISIIYSQIHDIACELGVEDSEEVILLEHIVLAHHGKLEYGSPVLPLTREAEVLTFIDNLDARMNSLARELDNIEPGDFTPKLFALENRSFYKPSK